MYSVSQYTYLKLLIRKIWSQLKQSWLRGTLARRVTSALNPPVVYPTDRSKAVVPVLVLLFVALWFILRGDMFYVLRCVFCSCVFRPFSIAIISFGEVRANLSAFCKFVRFVLVWICRFPLPLGAWEWLRFVIVALPGLFFYLFFCWWEPRVWVSLCYLANSLASSIDRSVCFFYQGTVLDS